VVVGDAVHGQEIVVGDAVNVAARLEQAAGPGEVLIGEQTWRLVRDAATVEPVAPLAVKGKGDPVVAFRLLGVRPDILGHARHLEARMVGRSVELGLLDGACEPPWPKAPVTWHSYWARRAWVSPAWSRNFSRPWRDRGRSCGAAASSTGRA